MDGTTPSADAFLDGGGDAARTIRGIDWTAHPLGPPAFWPEPLKIALGMMLNSHFPKAICWGRDLVTFHNDAFRPILGNKPEAMGRRFDAIWAEAWDQIGPIAERAFAGEPTFVADFPLVIDRFGYPEQCYFTFCYSPIKDSLGNVVGMMDTVIETTDRVETERQMAVHNGELKHRIRNTLSIVGSIARQTMRSAATADEAWAVLSGRLGALSRTHDLLTGGARVDAKIEDVIRAALEAHVGGSGQVTLDGPSIRLSEKKALALSLAVNELATNAIKHGALSVPEGRVEIVWQTSPGEGGWLTWTERDGPAVSAPTRRSFGTMLLEQVVPQDFGGTGVLDYAPEGLVWRLTAGA